MNNINVKNIVGGLNITYDAYNAYYTQSNYFSENIVFGVKAADDKTIIEADAFSGVVNIPKLQYYVNAYTLTYGTNDTNAETSVNFIQSYSTYIFPVIDATYAYTSYHVAIMAYTLPTKHYVDKLLELKDALIYRGTLTPSQTSGATPGVFQATFIDGSEAGSMGITYTTAGSVYKVTNTGYFGNIHVHAGDMIISYSDSATANSISGWNVIEMHITHDNTSDKQINVETGSENRLLTNVRILHDGMLTYTYTHLLEHQINHDTSVSESKRQYVEYIDVEHNPDTNDIYVSYHTKVLKFNNTGVIDSRATEENIIDVLTDTTYNTYQFITNIFQDIDGHLSYTYAQVKSDRYHHSTFNTGYIPANSGQIKHIINDVMLDSDGTLYFSYNDATIDPEKNVTYNTAGNKDISNSDNPENGIKVITGISMTSDGQLSYAYSYVYDPHNDHVTYTADSDAPNKAKEDDSGNRYIINNIYLNADGGLSYTWRDATILPQNVTYNTNGNTNIFNSEHPENGIKVITGINMTSDGQLSYAYSYVYDSHDSGSAGEEYTTSINNSPTKQILMNAYINSAGHLTYCYMDVWGSLD